MRALSPLRSLARFVSPLALALLLAACAPAAVGPAILAPAPASNLVAVSAQGARDVRILYVSGGSIVLMRTVAMPPGGRVHTIAWSADGRGATIVTSAGEALALDTRTWRIEPVTRLAATSHDARANETR